MLGPESFEVWAAFSVTLIVLIASALVPYRRYRQALKKLNAD